MDLFSDCSRGIKQGLITERVSMARANERLIGKLYSDDLEVPDVVWVYKAGRDYRITHGSSSHLCHPSVRDIEAVKRESFLVFHVKARMFEPYS